MTRGLFGWIQLLPFPGHHLRTEHWPEDLFVVPEYSVAVDVGDRELVLSFEHDEVRWVPYDKARCLLTWDSNRVALWELNERLANHRKK